MVLSCVFVPWSKLAFPSTRTGRELSDMALTVLLRRLEVDGVPHGIARATFKTGAAEASSFAREVVEQALAHKLENKMEAAYWRGDMLGGQEGSHAGLFGDDHGASNRFLQQSGTDTLALSWRDTASRAKMTMGMG